MDFISLIDFILKVDVHLGEFISNYHAWTYLILFSIIFVETGVVIMPFLPGDSLLFAIGAFAARGSLNIFLSLILLTFAAILGDSLNYMIGKKVGRQAFHGRWFLNKKHLEATERFYERHGPQTIILARFVPIVRTFAPFVAGTGHMNYKRFLFYNVMGGFIWVWLFIIGGYLFGNIPLVRDNFGIFIVVIILASVAPLLFKAFRKLFLR